MVDFNLILEKERLSKAVDAFATQMKKELHEQAKRGKRGWDGCASCGVCVPTDSYIIRELWNDATDLEQCASANQVGQNCNPTLVAIANRAMILWARHNSLMIAPEKEATHG